MLSEQARSWMVRTVVGETAEKQLTAQPEKPTFISGRLTLLYLYVNMEDDWNEAAKEQERQLTDKVKNLTVTRTSNSASQPPAAPAQPPEPEDKEAPVLADISLINKLLHSKGLVTSAHDIEVQRKDPTSPLYSAKSFEELHLKPNLLKGLYNMGFNKPSKIQETALPLLLADPPENMIAQSQSGTGKTAAFVLAMLSRVNPSEPHPQVLCLSPTFDLAKQTGSVLEKMAHFSPEIKMAYALKEHKVAGRSSDHIIIGTAGTVLDWILKKRAFDPKKIKLFVLDEADVMIAQQGQQDQTVRIQKTLAPSCQMCLFSATYDDDVIKFADQLIKEPNKIALKRAEETLDNIKQFYVECSGEDGKFQALSNLYGCISIGQAMVFCNSRASAGDLAGKMSKKAIQWP
eukprot:Em0008g96a